MKDECLLQLPIGLLFLYFIHNNSYFRSLFYYRIGPILTLLIGWWRPGNRYFHIPYSCEIDEGLHFHHPYSTVLNAEKIGKNFCCIHLTTLGLKENGRPIIGDNVTIGAGVIIVGRVRIGNNVIIGAGTVVVKDVPDNCIVVGNPAHIVRHLVP